VPKEKIAANGEFNLSGERYRENGPQTGAFPWKKIEMLVRTVTPPAKIPKTGFAQFGRFPIIDQSQRVSGFLCVGHNMTMPRSMYATQVEVTGERAGVRFSARPA
jgi:hypothetical protein